MLHVEIPPDRGPARRYVVDVMLREWLGLAVTVRDGAPGGVRISGETDAGREVWLPDGLFATPPTNWCRPESLPAQPLVNWEVPAPLDEALVEPRLPVLFPIGDGAPALVEEGKRLSLSYDVLGTGFFLVTRYEEVVRRDRDRHERFPARSALSVAEGFIERPLADECTELLWHVLKDAFPGLERGTRGYEVVPGHDVDRPLLVGQKPLTGMVREVAGKLLVDRRPVVAARLAAAWVRTRGGAWRRDPNHTFDFLMDQSEARGLVSRFYFIPGRTEPGIDADYDLEAPYIRALVKEIHQRGHLLGAHPSYHTWLDEAAMRSEVEALRRTMDNLGVAQDEVGGRQHYLRWQAPETWRNYARAGLAYDATLTFAERAGFRAGTSRPYPVFDVLADEPLPLWERPLVMMDGTVRNEMRLQGDQIVELAGRLAARCARYGGSFSLLWHNSSLRDPEDRALYRRILDTACAAADESLLQVRADASRAARTSA